MLSLVKTDNLVFFFNPEADGLIDDESEDTGHDKGVSSRSAHRQQLGGQSGASFRSLRNIPQTAFLMNAGESLPKHKGWEDFVLHSHEECLAAKEVYASNFKAIEAEQAGDDGT